MSPPASCGQTKQNSEVVLLLSISPVQQIQGSWSQFAASYTIPLGESGDERELAKATLEVNKAIILQKAMKSNVDVG